MRRRLRDPPPATPEALPPFNRKAGSDPVPNPGQTELASRGLHFTARAVRWTGRSHAGAVARYRPEHRRHFMTQTVYPQPDAQIAERRKQLAPGTHDAFQEFSRQVFADGALD